MDCSPPGSPFHGILQARILECVAICSPGDLPNPGIKPRSPALQADSLPSEPPGQTYQGSKYFFGRSNYGSTYLNLSIQDFVSLTFFVF